MQKTVWFDMNIFYQNSGGGPGGGPGHGGGLGVGTASGTADITGNATGDAGLSGGTGVSSNNIITSDAAPGIDADMSQTADADDGGIIEGLSDVGRTDADIIDIGDPLVELGGGADESEG
ncbi:MAG: hypothetical protein JO316_09580 [Abitibacteriaceae bacterium]|nr:hypothetical protein [Abditibacteriaceae bacterium]